RRIFASGPARVAVDIAAFHPAELLKSLVEGGDPGLCFRVIVEIAHQQADTPYAFTWLRARRERPPDGAAKQRDERATFDRERLPCFRLKDSTARCGRRLLRCGISIWPMTAMGSKAADAARADRRFISAVPPKPDVRLTCAITVRHRNRRSP